MAKISYKSEKSGAGWIIWQISGNKWVYIGNVYMQPDANNNPFRYWRPGMPKSLPAKSLAEGKQKLIKQIGE